MKPNIEEILNGDFDFSDEDIVIGNILELFRYSNTIINYLQESTNHIPSYATYREKITKNAKTVQSALDEKNNLEKSYREFLNSGKELKIKKEEVETLKSKIEEIKELDRKYAKIDIDELKKEHRKLFHLHKERYQEIGKIEDDNKKLNQLIDNFDKNIVELNSTNYKNIEKLKEVFDNITKHINDNWDSLDDTLSVEKKRFRTLTEQYNNLLKDIDNTLIEIGTTKRELQTKEQELSALLEKYEKLQNVYNTEFEQNSRYIEMSSSKLDNLSQELQNGLNQFNSILQDIINKNEKIKNEIREANR